MSDERHQHGASSKRPGEPDDLHLRAALRHAPDADVAPPLALTDHILREAAAAAARAASGALSVDAQTTLAPRPADTVQPKDAVEARRSPWWSPWRARLAAIWAGWAQPQVGAAVAAVMVAVTLGLWWQQGALDPERVPDRREAAAAERPLANERAAPTASTAPAASATSLTPATPTRAATKRAMAPVMAPAPEQSPVPAREPSPVPLPGPVPAPAVMSAPSEALTAATTSSAKAASPPTVEASSMAQRANDTTLADGPAPTRVAPQTAMAWRPPTSGPPIATLLRSLRAEPERWTLQQGDQAPRPLSEADLRWLDTLAQRASAARPGWSTGPVLPASLAGSATAAPGPAPGSTVTLWLQDGQPRHRLREDGAQWRWDTLGPDRRTWSLPLATDALHPRVDPTPPPRDR